MERRLDVLLEPGRLRSRWDRPPPKEEAAALEGAEEGPLALLAALQREVEGLPEAKARLVLPMVQALEVELKATLELKAQGQEGTSLEGAQRMLDQVEELLEALLIWT